MSQERWDIEILFLNGPLSMQASLWFQGPLVRIGKRPGADGMGLQSYPGVATVHATIQAYDGNRVVLSHIDPHAVRVATHEKVNWNQVQPIRQPVYLNQGDIVHLGSLDRGCRFKFLRCQTFEWRQSQMLSNIDQSRDQVIYNQIETRKIRASSMPTWFLPALSSSFIIGIMAILYLLVGNIKPEKPMSGPTVEGYEHELYASLDDEIEPSILKGFQEPFQDFVMEINGETSGYTDLGQTPSQWDSRFYKLTLSYMKTLQSQKGYWKILKKVRNDYSYVTAAMKQANLPEVFAAIPFQETKYDQNLQSPACAGGIWQFMPETGYRMGLKIKNCKYKGNKKAIFTPKTKAPPSPFYKAEYIETDSLGNYSCRITSCKIDERRNVERSTEAAIDLLMDTWEDDDLSASGSLVQMTIMAHNAGYNDKPYLKKTKPSNILPSYKKYIKKTKVTDGIRFYGDNIKCSKDVDPFKKPANRCGGVLSNQTQHYAYKVVAQHILAVCFFAKNYSNDPSFSKWEKYFSEDRYCTKIDVPSIEDL
jgi:hypothetical protein